MGEIGVELTGITDRRRDFCVPSGPLLHALYPGVFDQTGGWRILIGAQLGLCLGIKGNLGMERGWIGWFPESKKEIFESDTD